MGNAIGARSFWGLPPLRKGWKFRPTGAGGIHAEGMPNRWQPEDCSTDHYDHASDGSRDIAGLNEEPSVDGKIDLRLLILEPGPSADPEGFHILL